jgi:hypothetical protein
VGDIPFASRERQIQGTRGRALRDAAAPPHIAVAVARHGREESRGAASQGADRGGGEKREPLQKLGGRAP